jgi:hypothetical protein
VRSFRSALSVRGSLAGLDTLSSVEHGTPLRKVR